jgi:hypothetical protein
MPDDGRRHDTRHVAAEVKVVGVLENLDANRTSPLQRDGVSPIISRYLVDGVTVTA